MPEFWTVDLAWVEDLSLEPWREIDLPPYVQELHPAQRPSHESSKLCFNCSQSLRRMRRPPTRLSGCSKVRVLLPRKCLTSKGSMAAGQLRNAPIVMRQWTISSASSASRSRIASIPGLINYKHHGLLSATNPDTACKWVGHWRLPPSPDHP